MPESVIPRNKHEISIAHHFGIVGLCYALGTDPTSCGTGHAQRLCKSHNHNQLVKFTVERTTPTF